MALSDLHKGRKLPDTKANSPWSRCACAAVQTSHFDRSISDGGEAAEQRTEDQPHTCSANVSRHFWTATFSPTDESVQTLKELPQPQVLFTLGFENLKPEPSKEST